MDTWDSRSPLLVGKQHGEIPQNVGIELEDLIPVIQWWILGKNVVLGEIKIPKLGFHMIWDGGKPISIVSYHNFGDTQSIDRSTQFTKNPGLTII